MRERIYSERARLMFLLPRARRGKKKSKVFVSFTENYSLLHFDVKLQNYFLKYYSCAVNRTSELQQVFSSVCL